MKHILSLTLVFLLTTTVPIFVTDTLTNDSLVGVTTSSTKTYPDGYVMATDSDFIGDSDGEFKYIGTSDYVIIPHTIKGIPLTSYDSMFIDSAIKGVYADNPNIESMRYMFYHTTSPTLDIRLDTSSTKDVTGLLYCSFATDVNFINFDTSTIEVMDEMFVGSQMITLDLSEIILNTSVSVDLIFELANTIKCYVKTQAIADMLNASTGKPEYLQIIVK